MWVNGDGEGGEVWKDNEIMRLMMHHVINFVIILWNAFLYDFISVSLDLSIKLLTHDLNSNEL